MYHLEYTTRFKKDLKKIKSVKDYKEAVKVLKQMQEGGVSEIPQKVWSHKLRGDYKENWECHIKPDLLIIWF